MKRTFFWVFIAILLGGFLNGCDLSGEIGQVDDEADLKSAQISKKSYIVVLNGADLTLELSKVRGYESKKQTVRSAADMLLKHAGIADGEIEHVYGTVFAGFSVKIAPGQLAKLKEEPAIKNIEEDQVITLVQPVVKLTGKPAPPVVSQTTPWGIGRVGGPGNGTGKTAWIIDTGVDFDHPDLTVDIGRSKTFVSSKTADDDNGHGSHVAGIIAAKNNSIGVVGVAAGATLVAVKVLNRAGSGTTSGVIEGVDYVAANAAIGDVANMSLGGGISQALDDAVLSASEHCEFSLAAGNESDNANNHSPARVNGSNIYTVSAMVEGDVWASYSNYGNPPVDYCAPGTYIYSCYKNGGYATMSGTSMAAPHVAGILLLGNITSDGTVNNDPDEERDPIAHR